MTSTDGTPTATSDPPGAGTGAPHCLVEQDGHKLVVTMSWPAEPTFRRGPGAGPRRRATGVVPHSRSAVAALHAGYRSTMTSDLEATTDDLHNAIRQLWQQAQGSGGATGDDLAPPSGFGQSVTSVPDTDIAAATGLELEPVREYLDNADGTQLVVGRSGETRTVQGLL